MHLLKILPPPKKKKKTWNMWTKTTPRSFHFGGDSWFIFGMGLWPRPWQHWEKHHLEDNSVTNRCAISEPSNLGLLSRSFPFRFHPHTEYPSSVPYGIFKNIFPMPIFSFHSDSSLLQTIQLLLPWIRLWSEKNCGRKLVPCRTPTRILVKHWFFCC